MSVRMPWEKEFADKGFSLATISFLRNIAEVAQPGTISLDVTELEALMHEFRILKNTVDELRSQIHDQPLYRDICEPTQEQIYNELPASVIEDMAKNIVIIDPVTGKPVYVNQYTNRMKVDSIDFAHSKVHAGDFYTVSKISNAVASSGTLEIFIITGSTYELHMNFNTSAGGDSEFYLFEGTTVSANGTALTPYNNNRVSSNTAEASFYHTPTITGDGTQLYVDFVPGGSGVFGAGGTAGGPIRSGTEVILKQSTNYLVRVTNTSGGAIDLSMGLGFYEDT